MRIIFAGTPVFAVHVLDGLLESGHEIVAAMTQPDRPAGRGNKTIPGPVKMRALQRDIPVYQPENLKNSEELLKKLGEFRPDVLVVVAYGLLLPAPWLSFTPYGALNVHASLLPRWRGAAPIQRALMAGDHETGVCLMQMEQGLDTGPVLGYQKCSIFAHDTAGTLHDRLAVAGAQLLLDTLTGLSEGRLCPQPQAQRGITYASKILKEEAWIDWSKGELEIDRMIRALNPGIIARTQYLGQLIKIWEVERVTEGIQKPKFGQPGEIVGVGERGIEVCCGEGLLRIKVLQRAGAKPLPAKVFQAGTTLLTGQVFGEHK
ncbi:MAG: methionyl-tRNA formyltransferase [Betaproteobacteria bacterium]|jgi:methionyl-tRNA formyltransferase (EC 2.1.2.9)|nr:methionyl-tRNA formyltransferase [Betaproteobacteria bacterium]